MASKVFFNGRLWTTPASMSAINDNAMAPVSPQTGNTLVILGQSTGGQPGVAIDYGDPGGAKAGLLGGDLLAAVTKAFAPSAELPAPSQVLALRVGTATQATLSLVDAAGVACIALTSAQYGLPANATKIQIQTGTDKGLHVSVGLGASLYSQDDIARNALTIAYHGAAASAAYTVTDLVLNLFAPLGTLLQSIDLALYNTVALLADRVSSVPGFVGVTAPGSEFTPSLNGLDAATLVNVWQQTQTVTANLQAVIDWLNGPGEGLCTAVRPAGALAPPALTGWVYTAGGAYALPTISDWTNALQALQTVDAQWVVPLSADPAVAAACDAHCIFMSGAGRRERRCLTGPQLGLSAAQVALLPAALNSDRTSVVWPGYYDYDQAGVLTLYPPYFTAAVVAAGFAGSSPGEPMTNKSFSLRGLELPVRNPVDTDALINAGVLCLENTGAGIKVVRSISTWLANSNYNRVEVSCGAATDYVSRTVRDALQAEVGRRAGPLSLSAAIDITESTLAQCAIPAPAGVGVIVGDANSPAYRNITAKIVGDVLSVAYECSPVIPINFIPQTVSIVPYSGTASA